MNDSDRAKLYADLGWSVHEEQAEARPAVVQAGRADEYLSQLRIADFDRYIAETSLGFTRERIMMPKGRLGYSSLVVDELFECWLGPVHTIGSLQR